MFVVWWRELVRDRVGQADSRLATVAPTAHAPPGDNPGRGLLVPDQLDMLVTSDPTAERLLDWINTRLEERNGFTGG